MATLQELTLPALSLPKLGRQPRQRKKKEDDSISLADLPPLDEGEKQTLLDRALGVGMTGLQYVGETLDKPRRALYGALAGRREALNILPFSDALGLTDPAETITGRDALEHFGLLGKNEPGLDWGDVAGFALELPTDPLSWLSLGGSKAAGVLTKQGAEMAKALSPIAKAAEIGKGTRGLVTLSTPDLRVPFTKMGLAPKELGSFGTGKKAEEAYKSLWYSPYSPVPHVRKVFSPIVSKAPIEAHPAMDLAHEFQNQATAIAAAKGVDLFRLEGKTRKAFDTLHDQATFGGPEGVREAKKQAVLDLAKVNPDIGKAVEARLKPIAAVAPAPGTTSTATDILADMYDQIADVKSQYGRFGEELAAKLEGLRALKTEALEIAPTVDKHFFDDTVRWAVEHAQQGGTLPDITRRLTEAGYHPDLSAFEPAHQAFAELADNMVKIDESTIQELRSMGLNVAHLGGDIHHAFRKPAVETANMAAAKFKDRKAKKPVIKTTGYDFQQMRDPLLRKLDTGTINKATRDPLLTAVKGDADSKAMWQATDRLTGRVSPEPNKRSAKRALWEAAYQSDVNYTLAEEAATRIRAQERELVDHYERVFYESAAGNMGPNWRGIIARVRAQTKGNFDPKQLEKYGFDEVLQSVAYRLGRNGISDQELEDQVFQILTSPVKQVRSYKDPTLIKEALEEAKLTGEDALKARHGVTADELGMAADEFNPAAMERGAAGGNNQRYPGWTQQGAIDYLLHKFPEIPTYHRFDELAQTALTKHADPEIARLAAETPMGSYEFRNKLWSLYYSRMAAEDQLIEAAKAAGQAPPVAQYDWVRGAADPDEFFNDLAHVDPLVRDMPMLDQADLEGLVLKLYNYPKEVRENGLFSRGTAFDMVDYLGQVTRAKAALSTIRQVLMNKDFVKPIADADGAAITVAEFWTKRGLTKEGLVNLMATRNGLDPAAVLADPVQSQRMIEQASKLSINPAVADALTRTYETFTDPATKSKVLKLVDMVRAVQQSSLYMGSVVPFPAAVTRNFVGGQVMNMAAGIFDAKAVKQAADLFAGKNLTDPAMRELLDEIYAHGVVSGAQFGPAGGLEERLARLKQMALDPNYGHTTGLLGTIAQPIKKFGRDVAGLAKDQGLKAAAKGALFGGVNAFGEPMSGLLNFWEVAGGYSPTGAKLRAGELDKFGKPLDKLELSTANKTRHLGAEVNENANAWVEFVNRVAPFIALRKAGWDPHLAAMKVKEVQFDYRAMSDFDKKVFKRTFLFYGWMRKNLEQQARLLITDPGGPTGRLVRAENRLREEGGGPEKYVPKYLQEGLTLRLPGEVEGFPGTAKFWSQSGLFPIEEALNRFQVGPGGAKRTVEKLLSQTNPAISATIEALTGQQLATGRPLKDLYRFPTGDETADFMVAKSPFSRLSNTARQLADPRKSLLQKAFNLSLGGVKVSDVDVPMTKLLEGRQAVQEQLKGDRDIGTYESLYAKDLPGLVERSKAGDKDALAKLQLYQSLGNAVRDLRATRGGKVLAKKKKRKKPKPLAMPSPVTA